MALWPRHDALFRHRSLWATARAQSAAPPLRCPIRRMVVHRVGRLLSAGFDQCAAGLAVLQRSRPLSLAGVPIFWLEPIFLGLVEHISCGALLRRNRLVMVVPSTTKGRSGNMAHEHSAMDGETQAVS